MCGDRGVSAEPAFGSACPTTLPADADPAGKTERPLQRVQDCRHARAWAPARCQHLERLDEERSGGHVLAMRPDKTFDKTRAGGATDLRRLHGLGNLLSVFRKRSRDPKEAAVLGEQIPEVQRAALGVLKLGRQH